MYPLPVVIVGVQDDQLPAVRRELAHLGADVESEFASAAAAAECLRPTRRQRRLLVVQVGPDCDASAIERLGEEFGGWPILGLIPDGSTVRDVLEVNRAGACQVVGLPPGLADFHRAMGMIATQFGGKLLDRHVFAVAGAVGGSGTSTISINLAHEIAVKFRRGTILAELSLQAGALAAHLDIEPRVTLADLFREINRVDDLLVEKSLVPYADGLKILAGAQEYATSVRADPAHLVRIVSCFRKIADVTVLDVPNMAHGLGRTAVDGADRVVLVGVQNVPSIRSMKMFCEHLPAERLNHSVWIVINRYNPQLKGFTAAEIRDILGAPHVVTVSNDYPAVNTALNHGKPLRLVTPGTPILKDLDSLIEGLLGLQKQQVHSPHRMFGRMRRVLGV